MVYLCQEGSHEQVILDVRLVLGLLELLNQSKLAFVVDATAEGGQGAGTEQRDAWTAVNVRLSQITPLVEENPAREQIGRVRASLSATRCLPRNGMYPGVWTLPKTLYRRKDRHLNDLLAGQQIPGRRQTLG